MTEDTLVTLPPFDPASRVKLNPDDQSDMRIIETLSGLQAAHPFFASYLYERQRIHILRPDDPLSEDIETAATTGNSIYLNSTFFGKLGVMERIFVLVHEVTHDMLGHPGLTKVFMDWKHVMTHQGRALPLSLEMLNIAEDAVINLFLSDAGLKMPAQGVTMQGATDGKGTADWDVVQVYEYLYDKQSPQGKQAMQDAMSNGMSLEEAQGQAAGAELPDGKTVGKGKPGQGQHAMPTRPETEADKQARTQALQGAVEAGKRAGNLPGSIERRISEMMKPKVDWRKELREAIVTITGRDALDPSRFNKKEFLLIGTISPRRKSERAGTIVVCVDTSGSCSAFIPAFFSELAAITADLQPRRLVVLWNDTRVAHVDDMHDPSGEDIAVLSMHGGGGTDLRTAFDWVRNDPEADCDDIAAFVVLTDSETPWPDKNPGFPTLVVTTGPELDHEPWMRVIPLPEDA